MTYCSPTEGPNLSKGESGHGKKLSSVKQKEYRSYGMVIFNVCVSIITPQKGRDLCSAM